MTKKTISIKAVFSLAVALVTVGANAEYKFSTVTNDTTGAKVTSYIHPDGSDVATMSVVSNVVDDAKGMIPDPGLSLPLIAGIASVGITNEYARADHVHPGETEVVYTPAVPYALDGNFYNYICVNGNTDIEWQLAEYDSNTVAMVGDTNSLASWQVKLSKVTGFPIEINESAGIDSVSMYVVTNSQVPNAVMEVPLILNEYPRLVMNIDGVYVRSNEVVTSTAANENYLRRKWYVSPDGVEYSLEQDDFGNINLYSKYDEEEERTLLSKWGYYGTSFYGDQPIGIAPYDGSGFWVGNDFTDPWTRPRTIYLNGAIASEKTDGDYCEIGFPTNVGGQNTFAILANLAPKWDTLVFFTENQLVVHEGKLYRCTVSHGRNVTTSSPDMSKFTLATVEDALAYVRVNEYSFPDSYFPITFSETNGTEHIIYDNGGLILQFPMSGAYEAHSLNLREADSGIMFALWNTPPYGIELELPSITNLLMNGVKPTIETYPLVTNSVIIVGNQQVAKERDVAEQLTGCLPLVTDSQGNKTAITVGSRLDGSTVGAHSVAEGMINTASGIYSHAEGYYNIASGNYSHAEGGVTKARGVYSHAEGHQTTASGIYSHAEGYYNWASGDYSHAEGYNARTAESGDLLSTTNPHRTAYAWQGQSGENSRPYYYSHGDGTFNINPIPATNETDVASGFYIGEESLKDRLDTAATTNIAPLFETNKTYSIDSLCSYEGKIYQCTNAITQTTNVWQSTKWKEVDVSTVFAPLDSPAFTGEPTSTKPDVKDYSDRVATTEYVADTIIDKLYTSGQYWVESSSRGAHKGVASNFSDIQFKPSVFGMSDGGYLVQIRLQTRASGAVPSVDVRVDLFDSAWNMLDTSALANMGNNKLVTFQFSKKIALQANSTYYLAFRDENGNVPANVGLAIYDDTPIEGYYLNSTSSSFPNWRPQMEVWSSNPNFIQKTAGTFVTNPGAITKYVAATVDGQVVGGTVVSASAQLDTYQTVYGWGHIDNIVNGTNSVYRFTSDNTDMDGIARFVDIPYYMQTITFDENNLTNTVTISDHTYITVNNQISNHVINVLLPANMAVPHSRSISSKLLVYCVEANATVNFYGTPGTGIIIKSGSVTPQVGINIYSIDEFESAVYLINLQSGLSFETILPCP